MGVFLKTLYKRLEVWLFRGLILMFVSDCTVGSHRRTVEQKKPPLWCDPSVVCRDGYAAGKPFPALYLSPEESWLSLFKDGQAKWHFTVP